MGAEGICEPGETVAQTAMRELYEETGIRVTLTDRDRPLQFDERSRNWYFVCRWEHVVRSTLDALV